MSLPERKKMRLENYNYNENGAYFITICTKNRQPILSNVISVGDDAHIVPQLSEIGEIADKYIKQLNSFYNNISVDTYVIMPDHIHLLLQINGGRSRTPVPTESEQKIDNKNSFVAKFVSTLKRFCNKEYGCNVWQNGYYDHVVRNFQDYIETFEYIENNPMKWFVKNHPQKSL